MQSNVSITGELICSTLVDIINKKRQPGVPSKKPPRGIAGLIAYHPPEMLHGMPQDVTLELITPDTPFVQIGLGLADPIIICELLVERLGLSPIHPNFWRQIATTEHIQDFPVVSVKCVQMRLTPREFAAKIALWLQQKHSNAAA